MINKVLVYVIIETDVATEVKGVVGVASTPEKANEVINSYYGPGEYKETYFRNIQDSGLENERLLRVKDINNEEYDVKVVVKWFTIDEV
jgi:hypothetical protein